MGGFGGKFGISEFSHHLFFNKLPFFKDVLDVFIDGGFGFAEKLCHLILGEPDGFFLHPGFNSDAAVFGLIQQEFPAGFFRHKFIHPLAPLP
jgi:hypothetical protein